MKNLDKKYVDVYQAEPKRFVAEPKFPPYTEEDYNKDNLSSDEIEDKETFTEEKEEAPYLENSVIEEVEYEEQTTLKITPSSTTNRVVVDTNTHENLSKLEGPKVRFVDFYKDARTFLEKANSTKFVLVSYILLSSPILLILGYLSEDVYREILIIISLTYLGVDAYEKKTQVRHKGKQ